ncbi:hypothetical protein AWM68_13340 [Fictibacillus phosphorivorans]|uniref:Spore protein YkvP/CgeB glycosyl transferase-like domain-containing protein n=1 Tax=Fictibacillus phosphorivorans TaxID=1221500 RepID=A0A163PT23_9BACL|nr:glycosyltransferase [Fictibacillus phosphorivorans]KZE64085.1 hypothetical protein AWM68_13340 [Fictibacillus phosphorivorans]
MDYEVMISPNPEDFQVFGADQTYISAMPDEITIALPNKRYAYVSLYSTTPIFQVAEGRKHHFKVNSDSHYKVNFGAIKDSDVKADLIVMEYSSDEPVDVKCIPFYTEELLKFNTETIDVRFFVRLYGNGTLSQLEIGMSEVAKQPSFVTEIELDKNQYFVPKSAQIEVSTNDVGLTISSGESAGKKVYVSYKSTNNSFSKVPKESIFNINTDCTYEITPIAEVNGSGSITPIVIGYSETEKIEIISLELNKTNVVKFQPQTTQCRLAFTIIGTIQATFSEFKIEEYPIVQTGGHMQWLSPKEVNSLGLTPKKDLSKVKIAAIFDEFTSQCFSKECNVISFTPDNWKTVLTDEMPDLLLVESAWRGNGGAWTKKVQFTNEQSISELKELISWCKEQNIPTAFWNKEDPVHYNQFIETAKYFDYVFTTDSNMVPVYKEACGHERVQCLQFAAQPAIHNPITIGEREDAASFAGSYYSKHEERSADMLRIFNNALPYGLAIYDRNYEKVKQGLLPNNRFPEHLEPFIRGSLKYYEIDKAYKGFRVMININTVKYSPTMFARRVYEGLACGTPIISNVSEGVEKLFGDLICVSENENEIAEAFKRLFNDEKEYRRIAVEGIRRVLQNHTYAKRLEEIVNVLGLNFESKEQYLTVIGRADSAHEAQSIVSAFKEQSFTNTRLFLITDSDFQADDPAIKVFTNEALLQTYSNIIDLAGNEYVAVMSPNVKYNKNHLLDLALATKYANWEVVGVTNGDSLKFEQVTSVDMNNAMVSPDLLAIYSLKESIDILTGSSDLNKLLSRGARILSITTE